LSQAFHPGICPDETNVNETVGPAGWMAFLAGSVNTRQPWEVDLRELKSCQSMSAVGAVHELALSPISGHKSMQMLKRHTHLSAEDLVAKLERPPEGK
jgi:hypothetical protein